jgi:phosphatidate phosphatase APP1
VRKDEHMTDARPSRPPRVARLEDWGRAALEARLRRRGWRAAVVPQIGYGGEGWVRVLARVVLVPPEWRGSGREDGRGWRRFVVTAAAGVTVTVRLGGHTHRVTSGREGYVDERLDSDLEPGWVTATYTVEDSDPVESRVRIVGPDATVGLVSDVDDTVIETMMPRPLIAFRNAFLTLESDRKPVPGMSVLYTEITAARPDIFVVYLSTGAWNTAVPLTSFLARHGYPPGPLLLTDWGPTVDGWFRSGTDHKRAQLDRLFADLPRLRWLLVGDDGQHDPDLYADAAARAPDRVLGVVIRQVSLAQQVARGHLVPPDLSETSGPRDPVSARDGWALRDALRRRGILLERPPG